ncbi:MAG: LicD family protein [Prevotella sp.]|nr:LicD family protein [Prevotella sp.]
MKKIEDIQELRHIQMGILDDVHRFCETHGIRYFLSSGTLIGAVRHHGYIPWDDDIDIYMPRADYERFMTEYDGGTDYRVLNPRKEKDYYYTFAKVVDLRTRMVERETKGFEIGVYMDIFPVDYVSDNLQERERVFKLKHLLYKIRRCKIAHENPLHSRLAYLCYRCLPVSVGMLNRWIERLIILKQPTATVCNMTEAGPKMKGCFPAEDIASSVDIDFEGRRYKTMVGYQDYLTRTYGDYMQLPPEDQRVTHKFEAYWL